MIDAYEIGAGIVLDDDILGQVGKLADTFSSLADLIDRINGALTETATLTASAASAAGDLAANYERAAAAAERIRGAAGGFYTGGGRGAAEYNPGGFTMPGYADPALLALGGPDQRPDLAYGGALPAGRRPMPGISGHDIYGAMFAGGLAFGGISAFAEGLGTNVEDIAKTEALLIGQGVPKATADAMVREARGIQQAQPGVSFEGALQMIYDTFTVTKNAQESMAAAPGLAADLFDLAEIGDDKGGGDLYDLVKAAEIKGTLTTKNADGSVNIQPLLDAVDLATRVSIATGGKLQPADAFRIAQNAGPIFKSLDDDAYVEALVLSNELGPSRVGTGLQGFGRQLVGGKMSKQQAEMFARLGLLDITKFHTGAMGYGYVDAGGFKDQDLIATNPFEYINDDLVPGILKADPKDREAIIRGISQMFSTVPGQRLAITDILSQMAIDRQMNAVYALPTTAATANLYRANDPGVAMTGLTQSFDAFLNSLGSPLVKSAVAGLEAITKGVNDFTNYNVQHPVRAGAEDALVVGGIGAAGWALWKALTGRLFGGTAPSDPSAPKDASFFDTAMEDAEHALNQSEQVALKMGTPAAEVVSRLNALLALLSLSGDTPGGAGQPTLPPGYHWNGWGFGVPNGPVPVHVVNGADLVNGVASSLVEHQGGMPSGQTGVNTGMVPPAPGMPLPGHISP